eukprot:306491-Alexandrium_andersonii.AAC.1
MCIRDRERKKRQRRSAAPRALRPTRARRQRRRPWPASWHRPAPTWQRGSGRWTERATDRPGAPGRGNKRAPE